VLFHNCQSFCCLIAASAEIKGVSFDTSQVGTTSKPASKQASKVSKQAEEREKDIQKPIKRM